MVAAFAAIASSRWIYSGYARLHCLTPSVFDEEPHCARILSHCRRREKFARDIKEKWCYVVRDYDTEFTSIAETDREKTYELADVHIVTVGADCPVTLMSFTGKEAIIFHDTSLQTKCDDIRKICAPLSCRLAARSFLWDW